MNETEIQGCKELIEKDMAIGDFVAILNTVDENLTNRIFNDAIDKLLTWMTAKDLLKMKKFKKEYMIKYALRHGISYPKGVTKREIIDIILKFWRPDEVVEGDNGQDNPGPGPEQEGETSSTQGQEPRSEEVSSSLEGAIGGNDSDEPPRHPRGATGGQDSVGQRDDGEEGDGDQNEQVEETTETKIIKTVTKKSVTPKGGK